MFFPVKFCGVWTLIISGDPRVPINSQLYVDYNDIMKRIEDIIKQTILTMQEFSKDNDDIEFTINAFDKVLRSL